MEPIEHSADLTPLILLVDDQEGTSRAIANILRPKGHVVLKAHTGQQALDLVGKVSPDAVLIDVHLPDIDGSELVRRLKESRTVHTTTPIIMITGSSMGRAQRLDALGAGAWDILTHPLDPNELILRLDTFVRAKQEADRARDERLTDPDTGLYNIRGVLRRTKEINADALRFDRPLTCVAFGPETVRGRVGEHSSEESDGASETLSRPIAEALRKVTRGSDTVGRLGSGEFVVIAPGTNREGALRLADRVLEELDATSRSKLPHAALLTRIRAGLSAVEGDDPASSEDLLLRATMALRRAQADDGSFRVRSFEA